MKLEVDERTGRFLLKDSLKTSSENQSQAARGQNGSKQVYYRQRHKSESKQESKEFFLGGGGV